MSKLSELLIVTPSLKKSVLLSYGRSVAIVMKDVETLKDWIKMQGHFPELPSDTWLENILLRNKYKIEQTKIKLENYYTLRSAHPYFFEYDDINPTSGWLFYSLKSSYFFPLPQQLKNGMRVIFLKTKKQIGEFHDILSMMKHFFGIYELMLFQDYAINDYIVVDTEYLPSNVFTETNPLTFFYGLKVWQKVSYSRFGKIHFVNCSTATRLFIKLLRRIIKENTLIVHDSLQSLYEIIPQRYLPFEYGGEQGMLDDLEEAWVEELIFQKELLKQRGKLVPDDSKRNNEEFDINGTFRNLNLD